MKVDLPFNSVQFAALPLCLQLHNANYRYQKLIKKTAKLWQISTITERFCHFHIKIVLITIVAWKHLVVDDGGYRVT